MPKLIKIRNKEYERDILINIENISVIEIYNKIIYMKNTSRMYSRISTNKKGIDDVCEACGYHETPNREVEGKWMDSDNVVDWGTWSKSLASQFLSEQPGDIYYNNDGPQWSIAREVTDEEIHNPDIVFGVCKCKLPSQYAHVFKKSEHPNGRIDFRCVYCGEGGQLLFNPPSSDS